MNWKSISLVACIQLLNACGGGGGGVTGNNNTDTLVQGVVIDGYLKNAFVYLDKNDNGSYDIGEKNTTTNAQGAFTLEASISDLAAHHIIAVAISGETIDSDNPNTPIQKQYSMTAPIGKNSLISPITTLVAANVNFGLNLSVAETKVLNDLGLVASNIDIYKDYVAEKISNNNYQQVHNLAVATAEVLKAVNSTTGSAVTMSEKLVSVNNIFSQSIKDKVSEIKSAINIQAAADIGAASTVSNGNNESSLVVELLSRLVNSVATIFSVLVILN